MIINKKIKILETFIQNLFKYKDVRIRENEIDKYVYTVHCLTHKTFNELKKHGEVIEYRDIYLEEFDINNSIENTYWLILNKLATYKKWSPNTISNKIKELGMICFNNDKNNHPIDWLYNEYK
jgi:hypothetical protein